MITREDLKIWETFGKIEWAIEYLDLGLISEEKALESIRKDIKDFNDGRRNINSESETY